MKYFFSICLIAGGMVCSAQTVDNNNSFTVNAFDASGKPFTSRKNDIEGSPMLNKNWGKGIVKFKNGAILKDIELQFSLEMNELYFRRYNDMFTFVDTVKEFILFYQEEDKAQTAVFRNGYPSYNKNTTFTYYEVLKDGQTLQLLKYSVKIPTEQYNYGNSNRRYYRQQDQWLVYDAARNLLIKVKPDKNSVREALPGYAAPIDRFLKEKTTRLRSVDDLVGLIEYLNTNQ